MSPVVEIGEHHSWLDSTHPNPPAGQLECGATGRLIQGRLVDAASQDTPKGTKRPNAGYIDHITAALGKDWEDPLAQPIEGAQVDLHHLIPSLRGPAFEGSVGGCPSCADQHVHPPRTLSAWSARSWVCLSFERSADIASTWSPCLAVSCAIASGTFRSRPLAARCARVQPVSAVRLDPSRLRHRYPSAILPACS